VLRREKHVRPQYVYLNTAYLHRKTTAVSTGDDGEPLHLTNPHWLYTIAYPTSNRAIQKSGKEGKAAKSSQLGRMGGDETDPNNQDQEPK
jgi:hypothetical protein